MGCRSPHPTDVVVADDGALWFTDPAYGFEQGFRPRPPRADLVFRHDPRTGTTAVVADAFDKPNGLAFGPGERVLYVGDSGRPHHVEAFDVVDGERLGGRRRLAAIAPGAPDGIEVDAAGRVLVAAASGVHVLDPAGAPLGRIDVPGAVNLTWRGGGLLVTADTAIFAATVPRVPEEA